MFESVLIANRGEIAVRINRTLRRLGIRSVAVFSDVDAEARHVREADEAVRLGPAPAAESYLSIERVITAARRTGVAAIHPGYGFLAENPGFARACEAAGIVLIGPSADAIELMGDKIRAKDHVAAAGVPVVPWAGRRGCADADLIELAHEVGFPVLLKPSAGGGGKGMRLVRSPDTLAEEIRAARRGALAAFGDDTLLVERFVTRPRHIEIQVLADGYGNAVHLGERECSLQRRHQKVVEEAPSPLLTEETREAMGGSAVAAALSCRYQGVGTVEYIVSADQPDAFYFMEMNTRLQVEHPVTELVATVDGGRGIDLVEEQLRVAAGERLRFEQHDLRLHGHAIEARVYAEDPRRDFVPTGGTVVQLHEAEAGHDGVRVDSSLSVGVNVGTDYDPMLAKVIAWAEDRDAALRRLRAALADTVINGVTTNTGFLIDLLGHEDVRAGRLDTGLIERVTPELVAASPPDAAFVAAAIVLRGADENSASWQDPFARRDGWRLGTASGDAWAWSTWSLRPTGGDQVSVRLRGPATAAQASLRGEQPIALTFRLSGDRLDLTIHGVTRRFAVARLGDAVWLSQGGRSWSFVEIEPWETAIRDATAEAGTLLAPMPGTITLVKVEVGAEVHAGETLLVVEAMKMEHVIAAPFDGTVTRLDVNAGQTVAMEQPLAVVEAATSPQEA
jgi:acetyl-CoA/propionyl-CoA carboxylase biotin carboxyl carrier protein